MRRRIRSIGDVYGKVTVIAILKETRQITVACECGFEKTVASSAFVPGKRSVRGCNCPLLGNAGSKKKWNHNNKHKRTAYYLANRDKIREYTKQYRAARPRTADDRRREYLKIAYGLSPAGFDALLERQRGVCAICDRPDKSGTLRVDHCHDTGAIRGLLCHHCNTMLGHVRDRRMILARAIEYLGGEL